jgi:flagellar biosynthesis protein FliQ
MDGSLWCVRSSRVSPHEDERPDPVRIAAGARPLLFVMTPDLAIDLFKTTILFALYVVAPFLALILIVGLASSLLQSVTSMQEQTLTFVPKLIALAGLAVVLTPWLLRSLSEFTSAMIARTGGLGQ